MSRLLMAAVLLQDDSGPVIAPWLMAVIAILLLALFLWLVLRERRPGAPDRVEKPAEIRQSAAWTEGQRSGSAQVSKDLPEAAPAPEVFVPQLENVAEAPSRAPDMVDDLEIIEGIGPKIAQLLRAAGIQTFSQLADLAPDRLSAILQQGGIRMIDPGSWPEQARLAAAGDQAGLKALQDSLKGGRMVS